MADKYTIQKSEYLQFDAKTIEQYIRDRLNIDSSIKFTDHNYEGSYFSSIIEVLAYTFNVMMFYLNQTSTESKFSDAQLYENMNRIVKLVGYSPIGAQSALVSFTATTALTGGQLYVIPRYSYLNAGGTTYSFGEDFIFSPDGLSSATDGVVLYQGKFYEYPLYTASGIENEILFLVPGDGVIVDHFNINVYVKSTDSTWRQWERTDSLLRKRANDQAFEVRFNENGNYEIKFGNGINGKKLEHDDSVAVYYLQSGGADNEISAGALQNKKYIKFASSRFSEGTNNIMEDIWLNSVGNIISPTAISFNNLASSTEYSAPQNVDEIRASVPIAVKRPLTISQGADYDRVVTDQFSNFVSDVNTINNFDFISSYLKYYKDLGKTSAIDESRFLYNQVQFADSCNFNNMYIFIKPKVYIHTNVDYNRYLSTSTKKLILNRLKNYKIPTVEPIIMDPVYMAVSIGINNPTDELYASDVTTSKLQLIKDPQSLRDNTSIINDVAVVLQTYFNQTNTVFGMKIDVPQITSSILEVDGVSDFRVIKTNSDYYYEGLSFITWNPIYPSDTTLVLRSKTYQGFQVPYLQDRTTIVDHITISE